MSESADAGPLPAVAALVAPEAVDARLLHRLVKAAAFYLSNQTLRSRAGTVAACFAAMAARLSAHEGAPVAPHDLWTAWEWDPGVLIPLAIAAILYWRGSRPLWRPSAPGKGIRPWEAACFWAGWICLFLALCSPLHPLGEALFSAHMVQHEILMLICAPLFVLGRPLVPFLWALPVSWRRALGRAGKTGVVEYGWRGVTMPVVATFIQGIALWIWHAPALYQAALDSELVHAAQHLSFLGTALLFWWAILRGRGGEANYGAGILCLFITSMHSGLLGALLTFSRQTWYPAYQRSTAAWGLTPLEDQIAAGLVMWVPAGFVYIAAALALCAAYLKASDRKAEAWEPDFPVAHSEQEPATPRGAG